MHRAGSASFAGGQEAYYPRVSPKMSKSGNNLGPFFLIAILVVGFVVWRAVFGFDPLPWLRGMQLGLPLVCILVGAVIVVLWAGKFFSTK